MDEELGLAAQQYGAESGAPSAGSGQPITVEELMQLLMSGITPQQLIEAGVPRQLVDQAIAMLKQGTASAASQGAYVSGMANTPTDEQGLAARAAGMGAM